jgi:glycerol-3-phosphate dehydrogenase
MLSRSKWVAPAASAGSIWSTPIDLDDDPSDAGRHRPSHRLGHAARHGDMIVLDHGRIPQSHAMVLRAALSGRVFFKHPQTGQRLAGVQQDRVRAEQLVGIGAGQRGDPRQVLDGVER